MFVRGTGVLEEVGSLGATEGVRWYAVNTRPHAEPTVVANLERQGFKSFLPTCLKTTRHARQFRTHLAPLFPGYLFVLLDLGRDRWRSVNGTYGAVSLVMTGGVPRPVPHGIVEALQDVAGERGLIRFGTSLSAGQRVKVLAGPFAELFGTLEHLDDQGRARLLLEMMGSSVRIATAVDCLAPA